MGAASASRNNEELMRKKTMTQDINHWSNIATEYVNTWAETGNKMWKSWFELMGSIPTPNPPADAPAEFKDVAQRFFDNREVLVRFIKLSSEAWKDIFPRIESGEDWQSIVTKYSEQMRNQLTEFSNAYLKASKSANELWQLYLKEIQKLGQIWLDPMGLSVGTMGKAVTGHSSALIELNNFYWNLLYEETFGSLTQTPLLGPTRELSAKILSGFEAWKDLYKASCDYQVVLGDIQVRSFEALMRELVTLAEKGKAVKDWKEFQQVWSQVADNVFEESFCKEENLKVRGKFLNALNTYRVKQQDLMELYLEMMNIPSRSEVDEIHKTIYELKKQVKSLKKKLAEYESNSSQPIVDG